MEHEIDRLRDAALTVILMVYRTFVVESPI